MVGADIAESALNTSWFCSLELLLDHMLKSDTRPQPEELEPKALLPFVGREQDVQWVRRTVGKSFFIAVLSCDLPCWRFESFKHLLMRCALSAWCRSSSGCATCSSIPVAVKSGNPQSFLLSREAQALVSTCNINKNCHGACTALDVCQFAALPCLLRSLKEVGLVDPS